MTTRTLTKPTTAEFRQDQPTVVAKFNLRSRGITLVNIPIARTRDEVIAKIPSAADLDLIAIDSPAEWLAEPTWD